MELRSFLITTLGLALAILLFNCQVKPEEILDMQEYTGPVAEVEDAVIYYSDSAKVKIKMDTPVLLRFGSGDEEYPKGLFLEFYDKEGKPNATLEADYCYYTKKDDLFKATGNVKIKNLEKGDQLDTEELFWNRKKEEVFTDKPVAIRKDGDLHYGEGLKAKQDFSSYTLINPKGKISLKNQEEN